jgi:hypothetical protein
VLQLDPIERVSMTLSAGAVAASFALAPPQFATGLAVGVALEALNLRSQVRAARALCFGDSAGSWAGGFGMRFGLTVFGIVAALQFGTDPVGLLVGLSLAMPAVVYWAWRNRPPVIDCAAEPALAADDPSWDRWSVWRAKELESPEDEDEAKDGGQR